jgi:anti-sigma B factor antagonist
VSGVDDPEPDLVIDRIAGRDGSAVVLALRGTLDIYAADAFRRAFAAVDAPSVEVRLTELLFLDSSGLAALLATRRLAAERGQDVRYSGVSGEVRDVLERTGTLALIEG